MGAGASVRRDFVFGVSLAIIALRRAEEDDDDDEDEEEEEDYDYDDEEEEEDDYDWAVDVYDVRRRGGG